MTALTVDHQDATHPRTDADRMAGDDFVSSSARIDDPNSVCIAPMDEQWIEKHYPIIHRAAWRMTGNAAAAEDLAQETFIVALDRWDRFDGRSQRLTWVYGILIRLYRNQSRTMFRLAKRIENFALRQQQHDHSPAPDPTDAEYERDWKESVWAMVAELPERQRVAIMLRFAEQLPYQEIAKIMKCAVGTAKTRVHQGLKRLKQKPECERLLLELPDTFMDV